MNVITSDGSGFSSHSLPMHRIHQIERQAIVILFSCHIFRLNSSHGDVEMHKQNLAYIREIEEEEKTLIPVLLDLQGPKIRIGTLPQSIEIHKGEIPNRFKY